MLYNSYIYQIIHNKSDSLSFLEIAEKALNETRKLMSLSEIWSLAKERNWKTDFVGITPWATISAQVCVNIKYKTQGKI
ncbi:winged helix-turn-helix domain-containing protein [Leptospira broomii]|uniref:winged helix-turn-helix domain-containing protein n=1 Tax=Leptospira broomii TaxID=301541 RepID=UPI002FBE9229